ncbi:MAG: YraN family protein [Candidatus Cryptobacteroides sp.]
MENSCNHRRDLGRIGEDIACDFLRSKGHTVVARNYRCGHLEIDIISRDDAGIHFVEVKCRQSGIQAPPQESVDQTKQSRTARAAGRFFRTEAGGRFAGEECFFDIFAVTFDSERITTEWIPQAYIPIYM